MGESSTLKRMDPSLGRSGNGASRVAAMAVMTRVVPIVSMQLLSSRENCSVDDVHQKHSRLRHPTPSLAWGANTDEWIHGYLEFDLSEIIQLPPINTNLVLQGLNDGRTG